MPESRWSRLKGWFAARLHNGADRLRQPERALRVIEAANGPPTLVFDDLSGDLLLLDGEWWRFEPSIGSVASAKIKRPSLTMLDEEGKLEEIEKWDTISLNRADLVSKAPRQWFLPGRESWKGNRTEAAMSNG